jgi:hypothetical protein
MASPDTQGDLERQDRAVPATPPKTVPRKILESAVVIAAGLGLMALGTFGTFTDERTPFPPSSASQGR